MKVSRKFLIENPYEFTVNTVGIKAKNLQGYVLVTPEFIVLSAQFYDGWLKSKNFLQTENKTITELAIRFQKRGYKQVILRSSCTNENITDRGQYLSEISNVTVKELKEALANIYSDFKKKSKNASGLAIIVQAYKSPKIQGHMSNERRVDVNKNTWLVEKEFRSESEVRVERIAVESTALEFDYSISKCLNVSTLNRCLNFLACWFSGLNDRYHLEWLWDGTSFWIVQIDIQDNTVKNTKPGSDWKYREGKSKNTKRKSEEFEVLETVNSTPNNWYKIKCLKVFSDCKLPFWDIHILENTGIIDRLSKDDLDLSLAADLKILLTTPVMVRMDIFKTKKPDEKLNVLLPRTETIFDYGSAVKFLVDKSKYFKKEGLKSDQFCFLIHRFIPSAAGALGYAKPNLDRVRIDSTWGIVDGLYFHPHDSFEVKISDKKILKKLRCKDKYIDFDKNGNWYSKEAGVNFDWRQSLTENQIRTIAKQTQKIADHLAKPVTVMFFINDKKYYPEILPWIYLEDEIPEADTNYTNVIFSDKKFTVQSKVDFEELKKKWKTNHTKSKLLIKLNTDLYRDKEFIEEIAEFAKKNNYVVDIEGSILSHPYYVFYSKGVHVRCVDPLEPSYSSKEFYKLVRDKIPVLIQNNKEEVISTKVSPSELLHLLKEKAVEEALEFYWSRANDSIIEEMADILEVLIGACKAYGIEFTDIEKIADRKREKRGGFEKGIKLVATKENSLFQLVSKSKTLFEEKQNEIDDVKIRPVVKFFQKGEIDNFKSLTEVDQIHLTYINNLASKANTFRYLLKQGDYNSIIIEYREKDIIIKFENLDLNVIPNQLKLFKGKKK